MVDHAGDTVRAPTLEGGDDDDGFGSFGARFIARIDLALGSLGKSVSDSLDGNTKELAKLRQDARRMPTLAKISSTFTYSTAATAGMVQQGGTGAGVLVGGPEVGYQWSVRQIIMMGTTLTQTPAGTAWFLVAANIPNDQSPTSVVDFTSAIPNSAFYSPEQIYLAPNENLWCVITGGSNGVQYVCSVAYQNSPFVPRSSEFEI